MLVLLFIVRSRHYVILVVWCCLCVAAQLQWGLIALLPSEESGCMGASNRHASPSSVHLLPVACASSAVGDNVCAQLCFGIAGLHCVC